MENSGSPWLVLGVCAGAVIGDAIAVTAKIPPGYVRSVTSAPVSLTYLVAGALIGLYVAWVAESLSLVRKPPRAALWWALLVLSVAYWILIRFPYANAARE